VNASVPVTASVLRALFVGVAAALILDDTVAGVLAAVGCVAGIALSADLDQLAVSDCAYRALDKVVLP
jgi:hypothetical protein